MPHFIAGFHGVRGSLAQRRIEIQEIWIAERKKSARAMEILQLAREQGIPVRFKEREELSRSLPGVAHQGIVALSKGFAYAELDQIIDLCSHSQGRALVIAADHITDEGNLGALIRVAAFFGAHGLVIPKDRSASVSSKVLKRSSGAYVHLPIARVVNLGRALDLLAGKGLWIIGTAGESSSSVYHFDWNRDLVLVLGNEERGMAKTVRERCHEVIGIPAAGNVDSLNVAVAAGVILSEIVRRRNLSAGSNKEKHELK